MDGAAILDALINWGLGGVVAGIFFLLWKWEKDAREVERTNAAAALAASFEKRIDESRETLREQAATRATIEGLAALIKDRREAA